MIPPPLPQMVRLPLPSSLKPGLARATIPKRLPFPAATAPAQALNLSFTVAFATGSDKAIMLGASNISGYDSNKWI